jgi:hypothetical protein
MEFAQLLDITTVPVIYKGPWNEEEIKSILPEKSTFGSHIEGYVVRNADSFSMGDYGKNVAKYVRKGHIQTDDHWMKNWRPASLKKENDGSS